MNSNLTEHELLVYLSQGNEGALETIMRQYHGQLCHYSDRIVGNEQIAREVVSDVFLSIWRHREHLTGLRSLTAYLLRLTRNASIDCARAEKRKSIDNDAALYFLKMGDLDYTPEEDVSKIEAVYAEVENLSPMLRQVFKLYISGEKPSSIADKLHISVKTVRNYKQVAVAILAEKTKNKRQ